MCYPDFKAHRTVTLVRRAADLGGRRGRRRVDVDVVAARAGGGAAAPECVIA